MKTSIGSTPQRSEKKIVKKFCARLFLSKKKHATEWSCSIAPGVKVDGPNGRKLHVYAIVSDHGPESLKTFGLTRSMRRVVSL